ncbi:MAG: type II toxin-antitoxin system VapC family toxin [Chloroflexi bacterium]|nr:type II toxin-antitoxin system VapC family toxin [Chloroflexota bacterium]MBI2982660.1 type II toxin-antitoxin system VapC family toxin [Chloroflexota bacterium]
MRLLLDTQAFIWAIADPGRLSERARTAMQDEVNEVYVSAATAWEIAIKARTGKIGVVGDPQRFVPEQIAANSFSPLPVSIRHALKVADLPMIHRDPFDRLLVAQASVDDLGLVTADPQVRKYPVDTIW